jgi:hypothetical protein
MPAVGRRMAPAPHLGRDKAPFAGPSVAVRGKPTVSPTAQPARTPSAYLHRHVTASGFGDGPFSVLGRASVCSLALIAAGSCERAAGSGGAKRPRSGAAGALDAAGREQIMGCGGKGSEPGVSGFGAGVGPFLPGTGVTFLRGGTRAARGSQAYLGPRARAAPGDMMIDWVSSRLRGDAAAQSIQAVRLALRGRTGSG